MKLYGLKTCDTCRKALKWLNGQGVDVRFIDVRGDGFASDDIVRIVAGLGWQAAVNRKSTTWRGLSDAEREIGDASAAVALIARHRTLLKRPVIETGGRFIAGFAAGQQAQLQRLIDEG